MKAIFQQCWAASDSRGAFAAALKESGFYLSQGDRHGYVAVDTNGEVFPIARLTGKKTKEVRAKIGEQSELPTMTETRAQIAQDMTGVLASHIQEAGRMRQKDRARFDFEKAKLVQKQQRARSVLEERQKARLLQETALRLERFATGLRGLWHRITGTHGRVRRENEPEAQRCQTRDRVEKQRLIDRQLEERQSLQKFEQLRERRHNKLLSELKRDVSSHKEMDSHEVSTSSKRQSSETIRGDPHYMRGPTLDHEH